MSFIGTIRPLVKWGSTTQQHPQTALMLGLGFTIAAVSTYATVAAVGAVILMPLVDSTMSLVMSSLLLLLFLAMDFRIFGLRVPMLRRQTPKRYIHMFHPTATAFLWGLDTGLAVSTYRVSSLTWASMCLVGFGVLPWWSGAAYAFGFAAPLLTAVWIIPVRRSPAGGDDLEPSWLVERIMRAGHTFRRCARVMLGGAVFVTVILALDRV